MKPIINQRINFAVALLAVFQQAIAQVTITTSPDWKDALLLKSLKPSEAYMQSTNYNNYPRLAATAWTHSGYQITYRSLMRFELGSIPSGSTVQSATLYLNSDPAYTSGELSNQSLSGANSIYFQKVTQAWDASTVTWNTQPATTTTNRVWVAASATGNIKLLDDTGTQLKEWTGSARKLEMDVRGLPAGYYYAKIKVNGEVTTARILIE